MTSDEFRAAVAEAFEEPGPDAALLVEQCAAILDTLAELDRAVENDGLVIPGSKDQLRVHPALQEKRQQQLVLARLLRVLGLEDEPESPTTARARAAANARWQRERA